MLRFCGEGRKRKKLNPSNTNEVLIAYQQIDAQNYFADIRSAIQAVIDGSQRFAIE
jgi:hypothetical protein